MRALFAALAFAGLVLLLIVMRHGEVGLWDWDTYQRLQFIHDYRPDLYVDGHVLYHGVMRVLMALGLRDIAAIVVETALAMAAFLALLVWICRREGLSARATAFVVGAATLGSPGVVALFLTCEDNVLYFPFVLGALYLLYAQGGDRRTAIRRGAALGALLAAAMMINISLLVLLFALPPAIGLSLLRRDRDRALGLAVALATALVAYYLAYLVLFPGARIALHDFLPQAVGLRDFEQSRAPLLSLERLGQYRAGLRAMAMMPTLHQMQVSDAVALLLRVILPLLAAACAVGLAAWLVVRRRSEIWAGALARFGLLGVLGIGVVFPFVYEPDLIERWDVCWIGLLFLLVLLLKTRPPRLAIILVAIQLGLQSIGTIVVVAHHYGRAWEDPALHRARVAAREIELGHQRVVVLPYAIDRNVLADFVFRVDARPDVFLVRDDLTCVQIIVLGENPVPLATLRDTLARNPHYIDPALPPAVRAALR